MSALLPPLILPLAGALLCLVTARHPRICRAIGVGGALALSVASIALLVHTWNAGYTVLRPGDWPAPIGIVLVADLLGAAMVAITGVIAPAVAIYSLRNVDDTLVHRHFYALFHFLLLGVNGSFLTGDLFNLYVWFEVMLLASFVLVTMGGRTPQLEGGVKYLVINLLASVLFLSGVGLLYGKLGTLNMADIAVRLADSDDAFLINSSAMLLLAAFGIKAALFPFFFWLPASYPTPGATISALFAGLLTKVGVYALIRSHTLLFHAQFDAVQDILAFLAGATMVTGVLGAAAQYDIRKILSFHIISQIGYMTMGLAIGTPLAIAAAVFYTLHHIIVKTNLFLIAGLAEKRFGSSELRRMGGLYRSAPAFAALFFIPAFSLAGIPPLSGFWAKFGVVKAGLDAGHVFLVACALAVGALTLFSMTKIWSEAFWKPAPQTPAPPAPPARDRLSAFPCAALATLTVVIGLWSGPLFELAERAADQLLDPSLYIQTVLHDGVDHPPS